MSKIPLAAFRRARLSLVGKRETVTVSRLAAEMSMPSNVVRCYLKGVTGLSQEMGLSADQARLTQKYLDAIMQLMRRDIMITRKRIAALSRSRDRAVDAWLSRNESVLPPGVTIVNRAALCRLRIEARVRWLRLLHPSKRLTISFVAACILMDRTYLQRMMREDPSFRKALGF